MRLLVVGLSVAQANPRDPTEVCLGSLCLTWFGVVAIGIGILGFLYFLVWNSRREKLSKVRRPDDAKHLADYPELVQSIHDVLSDQWQSEVGIARHLGVEWSSEPFTSVLNGMVGAGQGEYSPRHGYRRTSSQAE
jgi:hypothetical protein